MEGVCHYVGLWTVIWLDRRWNIKMESRSVNALLEILVRRFQLIFFIVLRALRIRLAKTELVYRVHRIK